MPTPPQPSKLWSLHAHVLKLVSLIPPQLLKIQSLHVLKLVSLIPPQLSKIRSLRLFRLVSLIPPQLSKIQSLHVLKFVQAMFLNENMLSIDYINRVQSHHCLQYRHNQLSTNNIIRPSVYVTT